MDLWMFQASLAYIASSRLDRATKSNLISEQQQKANGHTLQMSGHEGASHVETSRAKGFLFGKGSPSSEEVARDA